MGWLSFVSRRLMENYKVWKGRKIYLENYSPHIFPTVRLTRDAAFCLEEGLYNGTAW